MTTSVCPSAQQQFTAYVRARGPVLLRTARSLTANPCDAEDLLQTALTKTYLAWDRIDGPPARWTATCAGRWSTPAPRSGASAGSTSTPARSCRSTTRSAGARPRGAAGAARRAVARGRPAAGPAAGDGRAAVLRGPQRGADGGGARGLGRHGEECGVPGAGASCATDPDAGQRGASTSTAVRGRGRSAASTVVTYRVGMPARIGRDPPSREGPGAGRVGPARPRGRPVRGPGGGNGARFGRTPC